MISTSTFNYTLPYTPGYPCSLFHALICPYLHTSLYTLPMRPRSHLVSHVHSHAPLHTTIYSSSPLSFYISLMRTHIPRVCIFCKTPFSLLTCTSVAQPQYACAYTCMLLLLFSVPGIPLLSLSWANFCGDPFAFRDSTPHE